MRAEGLRECRKMIQQAKAGKFNGYLLEGMACPGGCVAGAGTIRPNPQSSGPDSSLPEGGAASEGEESSFASLAESLD